MRNGMYTKDKSITSIYKTHIARIIVLIMTVIIFLLILAFVNMKLDYKNSRLVNVLGRQRMHTQIIAKDAGRVYELKSIIKNTASEKERESLSQLLYRTLDDLRQSRDEYEKQNRTIGEGYIDIEGERLGFQGAKDEIKSLNEKHNQLWLKFNTAVNTILNPNCSEEELLNAVRFVYQNNETLLNYSNEITNTVLNYNKSRNSSLYYIVMAIVLAILIMLIMLIKSAYKDLFKPVGQLYKKMESIGISKTSQINSLDLEGENSAEFKEVNEVFNKLNSLINLIENLSRNVPFKEVLDYIFYSFSEFIPYTHIGVALINEDGRDIKACYGVSSSAHKNLAGKLLGHTINIDQTSLRSIVETGQERIINDLEEYLKERPVKTYNQILLEEGVKSSITFPLRNNKEVVGIIFFSSDTKHVYKEEHIRFLKTLANSIMLSLEEDILIQDMIIGSTLALAALTEERDPETGDHLHRMKTYSRVIAELLSKEAKYNKLIDMNYINNIERFSPLHDIGKVAIKDEILLKPGKLTFEEFEIMKTHALYGANVLSRAEENIKKRGRSIFTMAIEIAGGHHEKWDGSGYPKSLKGENIPLSARIVAVADVFDALTSKRPYKEPLSFEQSISMINEGKGKHFDPEIIEVFLRNINIVKDTYLQLKAHHNS